MSNEDTRQLAEKIFKLSPQERSRVTELLGMTDPPPRPKTSRKRPSEDAPVAYRTTRVQLR